MKKSIDFKYGVIEESEWSNWKDIPTVIQGEESEK